MPADWSADFSQCLYEWQGLEAGALALLAAVIGARFIYRQIRQADDHRQDEIQSRHNAARVALPLALSEVNSFVDRIAENVAAEIESYGAQSNAEPREHLNEKGFDVSPLQAVSLAGNVIPAFQGFVETLTDQKEIRHVAELLSSIQILSARYEDLNFDQAGMEMTLYGMLLDAAKVGFLNDRLYDYGRYLDDQSFAVVGTLSDAEAWDEIHTKAHGLLFSRKSPDLFFGEIKKRIDRYKERGLSPWLKKMDL